MIKGEKIMGTNAKMKKIIEMVNEDNDGLKRYLQATAYNELDYYNFNGVVDSEIFIKQFYVESEESSKHKEKLCSRFKHPGGKNTVFIVGYQGSGKTTFINSLIETYFKQQNMNPDKILLIDCDKFGVGFEKIPLKIILLKILMGYLKQNENHLNNYCNFFQKNFVFLDALGNFVQLNQFFSMIKDLIQDKNKSLSHPDTYIAWEEQIKKSFSLKDLMYLLNLLFISGKFNKGADFQPFLIFIDNLDYIDSYSELKQFMMAFDDFTIDMSKIFSQLSLYENSDVKFRYVDKIKIVIAMRETTRANLPKAHFSDAFNAIYEKHDISEWYNKNEIAIHRLDQIRYDEKLNLDKKEQADLIKSVMKDFYTKNIFIPLFNNNYRSAISVITKIIRNNPMVMNEYSEIMKMEDSSFKYGARGILYKFILDEFNTSAEGEDNCLKKIGVIDLLGRKNNEVSFSRLILSYLSNYTETRCDDAKNCIKLSEILKAFTNIFEKQNVINSIWNMYDLKNSKWTHLLSFSQLERNNPERGNTLNDIADLKSLDYDRTTIHYSCAGKIYLEYVATHFEFFTTRIGGSDWKPLYSKENMIKQDGEYKFINIINNVFIEVKRCCESLARFNKKLCTTKNYPNPYNVDTKKYLESPYICKFKKSDGRVFKQFHEDRLVTRHIGYIDGFRIYVLNYSNIPEDDKPEINKKLVSLIKKYVDLLYKNILLGSYTKDTLRPYFLQQIEIISKDGTWTDYTTKINTSNAE